jgi:AraC-like DNA-binding protein
MAISVAGGRPNRTRIVRHDSASLRCEIAFAAPHPRLQPYVREYVGGYEDSVVPICRREVPSGIVPVIFTFAGRIRELDPGSDTWTERGTFTAGLHDTFALVQSTGPSHGLQVNFTALGARLFFQQPLHDLTNRTVELDNLLGGPVRDWTAELHDAPTWEARFELLDRLIESRMISSSTPPEAIAWAWRHLVQTGGKARIGFLVEQIGWSEKTLVSKFREELGLAPKALARVLRFAHALRALTGPDCPRLTDVAYDAGYYDQAHFSSDFRAFAGVTPTEMLALRLPAEAGFRAS